MKIFTQKEAGTTVVEFAVIATILFAFVFGIIEFGILMYDNHVLTNASREGARFGIVMRAPQRVMNSAIIQRVKDYSENHMVSFGPSSQLVINVEPGEASRTVTGTPMTVTVEYPFEFAVLSGLGVKPVKLTAKTIMKME